ncbi:MAG: methylated-DNA--[protein]-cysteine S-methyltransferase [Pseudomonadota bacterium]
MTDSASIATPLGPLGLTAEHGALTGLDWRSTAPPPRTPLMVEAAAQLTAYFDGKLTSFDLPLAPAGSRFQQQVMAEMRRIPFGQTRRYGDLAKTLGSPAQPIGQACGANPIAILIPCHRVLAATGVGGFSGVGGVETKIWLLRHEGAYGFLV